MSNYKISQKMAMIGIIIGVIVVILYWYDYTYNPFHLPTVATVTNQVSYSPPMAYTLFEKALFILCPGLYLQVFTIGTGVNIARVMWLVAIILNGVIYYGVGAFISYFVNKKT